MMARGKSAPRTPLELAGRSVAIIVICTMLWALAALVLQAELWLHPKGPIDLHIAPDRPTAASTPAPHPATTRRHP